MKNRLLKLLLISMSFPVVSSTLSDELTSIQENRNNWNCYSNDEANVTNCSLGLTALEIVTRRQLGKREGILVVEVALNPENKTAVNDLAEVRHIQNEIISNGKVVEAVNANNACHVFHNLGGSLVVENTDIDTCNRLKEISEN
ncbi:hypothetical protein [Vibrio genomosp. F10]|uniref:hypothetical protein n=1 Tax=Vibrio genomosp. F10 TaxID=723171 RepID=UPI0002E82400|nr:hypothetical protein [Vibrio genomosp. F10]OEE97773.1 hypothetical protein A1QK_12820 [Vibrio genomosp. F10 str. 9ZD137]